MPTAWQTQRLEQGYELSFINMDVARGFYVVAADGRRSGNDLKYGAKNDSQHAIIPNGGPVRELTWN
jgi:hypothetical protein